MTNLERAALRFLRAYRRGTRCEEIAAIREMEDLAPGQAESPTSRSHQGLSSPRSPAASDSSSASRRA